MLVSSAVKSSAAVPMATLGSGAVGSSGSNSSVAAMTSSMVMFPRIQSKAVSKSLVWPNWSAKYSWPLSRQFLTSQNSLRMFSWYVLTPLMPVKHWNSTSCPSSVLR